MRLLFAAFSLIFLLGSEGLWAQTPSPLEPFVTANLLLGRPPAFEEMQQSLTKEVANTEPGLRLEYVNEKRQAMREWILGFVVAPQVDWKDAVTLVLKYQSQELCSVHLEKSKLDSLPEKLRTEILKDAGAQSVESTLRAHIKMALDKYTGKDKKAIVSALLIALPNVPCPPDTEPIDVGWKAQDTDTLARVLTCLILNYVNTALEQAWPQMSDLQSLIIANLSSATAKADSVALADSAKAITNQFLVRQTEQVKILVVQALNRADAELDAALERLSHFLISGNAGVAVAKSEGAFSGGVIGTVIWHDYKKKCFEFPAGSFGLFIGHQLNPGDKLIDSTNHRADSSGAKTSVYTKTVNRSFSLVGATVGLKIGNYLQVSGIVSKTVGNEFKHTWEVGGTVAWLAHRAFVVGIGYFDQYGLEGMSYPSQGSLGLWFKSTDGGYPSLFAGIAAPNNHFSGEVKPVVQISYPIAGK